MWKNRAKAVKFPVETAVEKSGCENPRRSHKGMWMGKPSPQADSQEISTIPQALIILLKIYDIE